MRTLLFTLIYWDAWPTVSYFIFTISSSNSREILRERKCYSRLSGLQDVLMLRYPSFRLFRLLLPYPISWSSNSCEQFSSPSSGDREHRRNPHSESYSPPTLGGDSGRSHGTYLGPNLRVRDSPSPSAAIPLRDYLAGNPNFLAESSCSSLALDSHTSERPVSYPWEVS